MKKNPNFAPEFSQRGQPDGRSISGFSAIHAACSMGAERSWNIGLHSSYPELGRRDCSQTLYSGDNL